MAINQKADTSQPSEPLFFATPADFRAWLEANHESAKALWVGLYKKESGKPSITWPESVDQALCFGWIDGVRNSIDADSYKIRFTPRKPDSNWSAVNVNKVAELTRLNLMHPTGLKAFANRTTENSYSYEQRDSAALTEAEEQQFRANAAAWQYFQNQPPSYRKAALWWLVSAKQEKTRASRLTTLIADSEAGKPIKPLTRPAAKK